MEQNRAEVKPQKISFEVANFQPGEFIITPSGRVAIVADRALYPNLYLNDDCDIPIVYLGENRAMQWNVRHVEQKLTEEQKKFVLESFEKERVKLEKQHNEFMMPHSKKRKDHIFSGEVVVKIVKDIVKKMK